jgi:NarL family two-component system response regulator YdfI
VIRVLLESSRLTRAEVSAALRADAGLTLLDDATGSELSARVDELAPDVIVLEVEGDEAMSELVRDADLRAMPPVMLLAARADAGWTNAALRAGVRAVLPRSGQDLAAAIAAVAAGYIVVHPDSVERLVPANDIGARTDKRHVLTAREIEVLRMMAQGLANKVIAARLGISEHTVKFHVGSIFAKLHAGSRTEAVAVGARQGLVML